MFCQEFLAEDTIDVNHSGAPTAPVKSTASLSSSSSMTSHGDATMFCDPPFFAEYVYDALLAEQRFLSVKGQQEDAEEFLCFLLDGLHEEFIKRMPLV